MATRVPLTSPMRVLAKALRDFQPTLTILAASLAPVSVALAQSDAVPAASPNSGPAAASVAAADNPPLVETAQAATPAPAPAPAPANGASSQTAADGSSQLQEMTVTATRRSEAMSKVPISISAYSQEDLDMKGAKDFTDVVRFTPGVTLDENGTNNISIRGISSSAGAGTTGIYIDDTPIQMRALSFYSNDALPEAFDLDRIEVLRGPQGTLFGAGAEGGAVRYIMAQPNMESPSTYARTELSFTQGGAPSYEAGVAYGAPIIEDELGFRASLWYRHDGGWIDNFDTSTHDTTERNANYADDIALRLAVKWNVNENVTITPSVLYQSRNANDATAYWPILSQPSSNSYKNGDPDKLGEPDHYVLPAIKLEADYGNVALISNTSYFERFDQAGYDGTIYNLSYFQTFNNNGAPLNPGYYPLLTSTGVNLPPGLYNYRAPSTVTNELHTFAQEFRVQSIDPKAAIVWTGGVFFSQNRQTSIEEINDPNIAQLFQTVFAPPYNVYTNYFGVPLLPNNDSYYSYNYSQDQQLAAFGEVTFALTDQLKLTLGERYSWVSSSFQNYANGPENFGQTGGGGTQHETPSTPKASLAWQPDRDDLFYATYAKGFRIGGANAPIPAQACPVDLANLGLREAPSTYDPDTVNSFEIGAKNKITDDLRIASSIYYIQWQGIQQNVYLPICGFQFTSNFGNAVSKGADLQLEYAPNSALNFDLAIGYTDARYTTDAGTPNHLIALAGDAVEGASVTPAPPWTVALGGQYNFLFQDRKSFLRVDYQYQGHSGVPTASEDPRATASYDPLAFTPKAYGYVTLRLGTQVDRWNISTFIDNLFNTHPEFPPSAYPHTEVDPYTANPPGAVIRAYTLRPRTIGVTASYRM